MKLPPELLEEIAKVVDEAIHLTVDGIKNEVGSRTLEGTLYVQRVAPDTWEIVAESPVWGYLNDGTGIFNPEHAGAGPGGTIIPINAKAIHFKNAQIAAALGFPTEDVFLKSVDGIRPRYFFERFFTTSRFDEYIELAQRNRGV